MASDTSTLPQQSAMSRVFALNEILEIILSFVPLEERFRMQRVTSSWQATFQRLLIPWTTRTPSELKEVNKVVEQEASDAREAAAKEAAMPKSALRARLKQLLPMPPPIVRTQRPRKEREPAILNTAVLSLGNPDRFAGE